MKQRPLLYSAPMVRATRADTKTLTRRIVKGAALEWLERDGFTPEFVAMPENGMCPYGYPGDQLRVRETFFAWGHWTKRYSEKKRREEWHFVDETMGTGKAYRYEADEKLPRRKRELHEVGWWKRPAIFMPRAASRITLEITSVRVERLQDISEADARAEGITDGGCLNCGEPEPCNCAAPQPDAGDAFAHLWMSINGPDSWAANPWVWVVEFRRLP